MNENLTGLFGKLPAHGDFIYRDLPTGFINVWDEWLQGYVASAQEQLGERWLELYLISPIWRFAFSEGVVDGNVWAGIMLPSVDRVGRYFPFSVVTKLPGDTNPVDFICTRRNWFQAMEDAALNALDGQIAIEELVEELNDSFPMKNDTYRRGGSLDTPSKMMVPLSNNEQAPNMVLPYMLDACLSSSLQSYSVWSTSGSETIHPGMFISKGLPALNGVAAMLDGCWDQWQWQQPFNLASA
ncbi:MAG: type VI secretion system-associated protein TagF [Agarilytica sp.]